MSERAVFKLLWQMYHELEREDEALEYSNRLRDDKGMIISRYAHMIDDRIDNSGNSRSVDSLKFYTVKQLKDEIESRKG